MGPGWVPVAHSLLVLHFVHSPVGAQYGSVELGQDRAPPEPLSPAHATQVWLDVSQLGVLPEQSPDDVHCTHALVAVSHAGVPPEQSLSARHGWHVPAFTPDAMHTPDRHWASAVQPECPSPIPHSLLPVSHTPETQARAPRVVSHAPPGMAWPFVTLG